MAMPLIDQLRAIGIRQANDPILRQVTVPFDLPEEAAEATEVRARLLDYVDELRGIYPFTKGVGIAAPQIGISRAMAVISPPGSPTTTLINPMVVWSSDVTDEQFEGCLSMFDVRGRVVRTLAIEVRTTEPDGATRLLRLDRAAARLALHEIDHLAGRLYVDRVTGDMAMVSLDEYGGAEAAWEY
jgi:peptide deformylase